MKGKQFLYSIFTLGFLLLSGCEKDDICALGTQTTPKLVINFYENLNPSVAKNINKIQIFDIENPEIILEFNQVNTIKLPLRTDTTKSNYIFRFIYNNINTEVTNDDLFEIEYSKDEIYVSRGCGYKSNFILNETTPTQSNPKITDIGNDEFWIKETIIRQPIITSENEAHLDILF